ncbi:STAS domain-containing protein [Catellatospora coxensis]|uniref:STAS domain-containing protein n=1 Tax=Catellatospora coxensis TaxID=310354 RepID=A0A8J3KT27_9ACTN|nr:STAS domain-containing protein [Catellatospora coxensis]GIG05713.1 hypothetical protein Cco03nite_24130 [Catellatospora coxensis]
MPASCDVSVNGDECTVKVVGEIIDGDVEVVVDELCQALDGAGCRRLVVDLGRALVLEPAALTALARIQEHALSQDITMRCVHVQPWLRRTLEAANLSTLLGR